MCYIWRAAGKTGLERVFIGALFILQQGLGGGCLGEDLDGEMNVNVL